MGKFGHSHACRFKWNVGLQWHAGVIEEDSALQANCAKCNGVWQGLQSPPCQAVDRAQFVTYLVYLDTCRGGQSDQQGMIWFWATLSLLIHD